jgi:hypothetical protein
MKPSTTKNYADEFMNLTKTKSDEKVPKPVKRA